MIRSKSVSLLSVYLLLAGTAFPGELGFQIESGGVWFNRNETRIPGDSGTRFDLLELTGSGPDPYVRLDATYAFTPHHSLRLTYAPLEVEGTGRLSEEVLFQDRRFSADTPTRGTYVFNTYRLTYRYSFVENDSWELGAGAALLVRDADIALKQGSVQESRDDLGAVPLLHLYGAYQIDDRLSLILDVEGAWSPVGRAFDVALKAEYELDSAWYGALGYRTLEGGADNDDVYTFAWLHFAVAQLGYRF